MSRRSGTLLTSHPNYLLFSSNLGLVSLAISSKYFGFKSDLCCFLLSSKMPCVSTKHRWADLAVIFLFCVRCPSSSVRFLEKNLSRSTCCFSYVLSWPICFPLHVGTFAGYCRDFVLVHQTELRICCCSCCCPIRWTKHCGCSRISSGNQVSLPGSRALQQPGYSQDSIELKSCRNN